MTARQDGETYGIIKRQRLYDIGDAIRGKLGVETTYSPAQMATAVTSIPTLSASVTGAKLTLTGTDAEVNDETLSIGGGD